MNAGHHLVKNVFLFIGGLVLAFIIWQLFFGNRTTENTVIRWAGRAVESPIARYYYEYSYIPNAHANDYVDDALGGTNAVTDIYQTPSNLSPVTSDTYNFGGSIYPNWTTGWY